MSNQPKIDADKHEQMSARRQAERIAEIEAAHKKQRLQRQFAREKARSLLLLKDKDDYIQDPATGRFGGRHPGSGGDGGGTKPSSGGKESKGGDRHQKSTSQYAKNPKSASSLYQKDTTATKESLVEQEQKNNKNTEKYISKADAHIKAGGGRETIWPVSKGGHKLPDGTWTPERLAMHQKEFYSKIMSPEKIAAARPKPGERPTMYILGGRGGSGKGWITDKDGPLYEVMKNALYLNSDDVKEMHPEWKGWNASTLHEESSEVGKALEKMAAELGVNVILDLTMATASSTEKRINLFKEAKNKDGKSHNYRIEGYYMYAPPEKAAAQAIGRFVRGTDKEIAKGSPPDKMGRYVLPEIPLNSTENEHNFDHHAERGDFDYWEIYDNGAKGKFEPKPHATGGKKR